MRSVFPRFDPSRNLFVFVIWAKARKFEPQIREALAREETSEQLAVLFPNADLLDSAR